MTLRERIAAAWRIQASEFKQVWTEPGDAYLTENKGLKAQLTDLRAERERLNQQLAARLQVIAELKRELAKERAINARVQDMANKALIPADMVRGIERLQADLKAARFGEREWRDKAQELMRERETTLLLPPPPPEEK